MAVDALAAQLDAAKLSASEEEEEDSVVLIDDVAECKTRLTRLLEEKEPVAVDFEGVDLCRAGKLCVVQLAPRAGSVLLVDVEVLGEAAFGAGRLRELLESPMVLKIGYDGRADSDALWHLHGTRLKNVWDVQVRCPWCSSCKPPQNPSSLLQSRARPRPTWATSIRPPVTLSYVARTPVTRSRNRPAAGGLLHQARQHFGAWARPLRQRPRYGTTRPPQHNSGRTTSHGGAEGGG